MKRKAFVVFTILAILLFASCTTSKLEQSPEPTILEPAPEPTPAPEPEPVPEPEPIPEPEVQPEPIEAPRWTVGETGPNGGIVFVSDSLYLEAFEPVYEVPSYDEALLLCADLSSQMGIVYRLPTLEELKSYYEELVITEISDVDWTYYWSSDESDDTTVMILNFDTGFEGSFYRDMDFVSVILVTEI